MVLKKQSEFIAYEIWILTFGGGLQRSGVYAKNVSDEDKLSFRTSVREEIIVLVKNKYEKSSVTSDSHIKGPSPIVVGHSDPDSFRVEL